MIRRIRFKFILINMTLLSLTLIAVFSFLFLRLQYSLSQDTLQHMNRLAISARADPESCWSEISDISCQVLLVSPSGDYSSSGSSVLELSSEAAVSDLLQKTHDRQSGVLSGTSVRFLRTEDSDGIVLVLVELPYEQLFVSTLKQNLVYGFFLSLVLFLIITCLLSRGAISPLEQTLMEQKRFISDASHELKTPLTVLMTNAELLQSADDPRSREKLTDNILVMSRQMRGLVNNLLELARAENAVSHTEFSRVDLSHITEDAILPFEPLLYENGFLLETEIEPRVMVNGSEAHLREITEIFLDNANKYAPSGARVIVRLKRHGRHAILSVSNEGEPIDPEDLRIIFTRFFRADRARAMNNSYGLGLPIAKAYTEAHHGKILAESAGGYNTFTVILPIII